MQMELGPTRRQLVRDGITAAGGAAGVGVALSALTAPAVAAAAATQSEARVLTNALQIEQLLLTAYRQVVASSVVHPSVAGQLRTHLSQEAEHVALLERTLTARGETIPPVPSLAGAQAALTQRKVHWSLTNLPNQHACLKLLVDIETLAENAYFQVIGRVRDPSLVRTCAEIMANEAQHWTVIGGFLNHLDPTKAVPYPFVGGTP